MNSTPGRIPYHGFADMSEREILDLVEDACEVQHDVYEQAAVTHGWGTNPASRHKPWAEVPEANKATMRAAVRALLSWYEAVR